MDSLNILHVDDIEQNRMFLLAKFAVHNIAIDGAGTAAAAIKKLRSNRYDATIIDLHMPVMDGFALMQEIENQNLRLKGGKFFVLTADNTFQAKERAFAHGIDDYLTLNMDPNELVLRIFSRIQRSADNWQGIELDPDGQGFFHGGELYPVTRIEYRILCHLVRAAGSTISRDELRERAWPGEIVLDQTLNTHVSNLRSKLRPLGFDVRALRNQGFKLVE